jgi:hypothetical protein
MEWPFFSIRAVSPAFEYKNPYNSEGCVWAEEFVTEDLGEEDIVGLVFGFEHVATEGAVG